MIITKFHLPSPHHRISVDSVRFHLLSPPTIPGELMGNINKLSQLIPGRHRGEWHRYNTKPPHLINVILILSIKCLMIILCCLY